MLLLPERFDEIEAQKEMVAILTAADKAQIDYDINECDSGFPIRW